MAGFPLGVLRPLRRASRTMPDVSAWGSPFFGSHFCLIGEDLAFVVVSKNACTFLKRVALLHSDGRWVEGFQETHDRIGYTADSPHLVPVAAMPEFEAARGRRLKFAVWRDPLARLESAYAHFVLGGAAHVSFDYHGLREQATEERFMGVVRWEWGKADPAMVDEHFRRQSDVYAADSVDAIVAVESLDAFLTSHGVRHVSERSNSSRHRHALGDPDFRAEAERYYAADLDLAAHLWRSSSCG